MLIVISPAKTLDTTSKVTTRKYSEPRLLENAAELVKLLGSHSFGELQELFGISDELTELNVQRIENWTLPFTTNNARPALFTFQGDTYIGMDAPGTFNERDFTRAQKTLRILSGLYGVLRPLDLIQPYRLEMGSRLPNKHGPDLYHYWGNTLTQILRSDVEASPGGNFLVNLASEEYFRSVDVTELGVPVVAPCFLDFGPSDVKRREPKVISFHAKRARGAMAGWLIRERINSRQALAHFDGLGYVFDESRSTPHSPTFVRAS